MSHKSLYLKKLLVKNCINNTKLNKGVGRTLGHKLSTLGVSTCGELSALSLETLQSEFGNKTGLSLYK